VLLRARMNALPRSSKPTAPHGAGDGRRVGLTAVQMLAQRVLSGVAGDGVGRR